MELTEYQKFVDSKTSEETTDFQAFIDVLDSLRVDGLEHNVNVPQMLAAAVGLSAEAGEFTEIVKKMIFQGKPLNEGNRFHMKRELGDAAFYLAMACSALGYTFDEIVEENVTKLSARYKDGFTVDESENRKVGDL